MTAAIPRARAPTAERVALIHRYWQRNAQGALPAMLGPGPSAGQTFDLCVIRRERGKLVQDRFVYRVETRAAPADAAFDLEFRIVAEGVEVERGRFYAKTGGIQ